MGLGPPPTTSATGGSAASQAASLDERAWTAHPWLARGLRLAMFLGPMVGGFVAVAAAMRIVGRPSGIVPTGVWIVLLVGVSAAGAHVVQTMTMRLAPLSALFRLSLVFPDQAPSRFSIALRAGSTRRLEERVDENDDQQAAAEHLLALVARLSRHDRSTRGHSERVRAYSVMLGEQIGLPRAELDKLNWAALIHDVGKLHVPEEILSKPDRPTEEEWQLLRGHPGAAARHVEPLRPWLGDWVDAATQHHERYDGEGYPAGLAGDEISLAGRLVSIADAFDVMTAPRSYKPALPHEQARAELSNCAGTQFDPELVRSFLRVSLGRTRWAAGPVGWLSHFPEIVRTPLVTAASSGQSVVVATAVTVAASAGLVAPPAEPEQVAPVERVADPDPADDGSVPLAPANGPSPDIAPGVLTTTPTTTATTTTTAPTTTTSSITVAPAAPVSSTTTTIAPGAPVSSTTTTMAPGAPVSSTTTTAAPGAPVTTTAPTTTTPAPDTSVTTTTAATPVPTTTTSAPPVTMAVDDSFTVTTSASTVLQITTNDVFGPTGPDPTTLEFLGPAHHGTVTVSGLTLRYEADDGVTSGVESFGYTICTVGGDCDTATVTVTLDIT